MIIKILNLGLHLAFFIYTMTYVVIYIQKNNDIRDIVLMAIFSVIFLFLIIQRTYFNKMKKEPGYYSETFSHRKERFPISF